MMEGHCCRKILISLQKINRSGEGDMLHNDVQSGKGFRQALIHVEKFFFPVEHKTIRLAVDQERNLHFFH